MFNVYVSQRPHDSYQSVAVNQIATHNQNLRIVDLGNVPARFLMIEVTNGEPLPNDEDAVQVYGVRVNAMDSAFGTGEAEMLMDKAFKIIYGFNKSATGKGRKKPVMM